MAENENSLNNYKTLKISTGAKMKNQEIQRFISNIIKTKKIYKNVIPNNVCS